jgi:hypothetical protein
MKNNLKTLFVLAIAISFNLNLFAMSEDVIENSAKLLIQGVLKPIDFNLEQQELIDHVKYALIQIRNKFEESRNNYQSKRNEQTDGDLNEKLCLELLSKPNILRFTLIMGEITFFVDYNPADKAMFMYSQSDNKCSDKCCRVS